MSLGLCRAGGRLLRSTSGSHLPGIGGHALGDSQSWWQEDAGLLVSCAHRGEVRTTHSAPLCNRRTLNIESTGDMVCRNRNCMLREWYSKLIT